LPSEKRRGHHHLNTLKSRHLQGLQDPSKNCPPSKTPRNL